MFLILEVYVFYAGTQQWRFIGETKYINLDQVVMINTKLQSLVDGKMIPLTTFLYAGDEITGAVRGSKTSNHIAKELIKTHTGEVTPSLMSSKPETDPS